MWPPKLWLARGCIWSAAQMRPRTPTPPAQRNAQKPKLLTSVCTFARLPPPLCRPCCWPQVVIALGSVAGRLPDGSYGYQDGASPKDVEGKGECACVTTCWQ